MSESKYLSYQRFPSEEQAIALGEFLEEQNIDFIISNESPSVDITFSGSNSQDQYVVKLRSEDFDTATKQLEDFAKELMEVVPEDHYLLEFSKEELYEILHKPDEWSPEDFMLSVKLLREQGEDISDEQLSKFKEDRLEEIRKPETAKTSWVIFGFLTALFGGLFGLITGYFYMSFKKTDPTGMQVFAYDEASRATGKKMFILGLIMVPVWVIILFML